MNPFEVGGVLLPVDKPYERNRPVGKPMTTPSQKISDGWVIEDKRGIPLHPCQID